MRCSCPTTRTVDGLCARLVVASRALLRLPDAHFRAETFAFARLVVGRAIADCGLWICPIARYDTLDVDWRCHCDSRAEFASGCR